ncbi:MAG: BlaI/MecI/CopY family transcriptional regulator [Deferrisomatales bacterium]|nr:BlaI/MecI/CopY family transcriptional regulator [Deferrisomatales bacterium]
MVKTVHRNNLGELETVVMEALWEAGPSSAKAVHRDLGRDISLNTVQSTLERLSRKGLAQREKVSHAYVYSSAVTRRELMADLISGLVDGLSGGNPEAMLSAFVDLTERTDDATLDQLEQLIAQRRAKRD